MSGRNVGTTGSRVGAASRTGWRVSGCRVQAGSKDAGVDGRGGMVEGERGRPAPEGASSGDLEYDEAHDAVAAGAGGAPRPHEPVRVTTETADAGGDYAYDLAHDVPRSSGSSGTGTR